ncbi:MAG: hypothetical protein LC748_15490 [Thermomicrobia bacterium]|nr:hypothetical protein [Thermomicrobia bacterium]
MPKPHIYVHRAGDWYGLYMNADNEARLREFATVTSGGTRTEPYAPGELIHALQGVDGILSLNGIGATEITTDVLAAVGTVRAIAISHWWHSGHVPAREMWEAAGVAVIDASDATTEAVVEWVLGAALIGVRRMVEFDRRLKSGDLWAEPGRRDAGLLGESVVGLIGAGRVGRVAAERFRAFGATLIAYDPFLSDGDARAHGIRRVSLNDLLATADVISLHMAVSDATRGMLGARESSPRTSQAIPSACSTAAPASPSSGYATTSRAMSSEQGTNPSLLIAHRFVLSQSRATAAVQDWSAEPRSSPVNGS